MNVEKPKQVRRRVFAHYLRTGRRVEIDEQEDAGLQMKFNPNHDPKNGQFTFGQGTTASNQRTSHTISPKTTGRSIVGSETGPRAERLGALSGKYESSGNPGTVSPGKDDPGGASYGTYQLSLNKGTLKTFLDSEDFSRWRREFKDLKPGTQEFDRMWKVVAARDDAFGEAQHNFIARTHYAPAVSRVKKETGLDIDSRHIAVREATWSAAVQHRRASALLSDAVQRTDNKIGRRDKGYDKELVDQIYRVREAYVLHQAEITKNPRNSNYLKQSAKRYAQERMDAHQMF